MEAIDPFVFRLSIFVLAIFVGYFVVWAVTPALHTPLMSVTNAISSVIVVGALIAASVPTEPVARHHVAALDTEGVTWLDGRKFAEATEPRPVTLARINAVDTVGPGYVQAAWTSKILGFGALILACVNIFGGFLVTSRMLAMYKKKEKPAEGAAK